MLGWTPVAEITRSTANCLPLDSRTVSGASAVDGLDPRRRIDGHALLLDPALDHAARALAHHARHHAVAHFHDRELHAARGQRFHDDAADEARAHLQHPRARFGQRHDLARVGKRPAGVHPRQVDARDAWPNRCRAGGDQQPVEREHRAVVEPYAARPRIHRRGSPGAQLEALPREVVLVLAQVGPLLADVTHQEIGNRHARIRRFGLVADEDDGIGGRMLADGFRRNDAGGAVTENDVLHRGLHQQKGRFTRNRPCPNVRDAARRRRLTIRGAPGSPVSAVPCRPSRAACSTRAASCPGR